jgi:hypothetical protein
LLQSSGKRLKPSGNLRGHGIVIVEVDAANELITGA